jgi:hypothetical protein
MGSRSFDVKIGEIKALSSDIQVYGSYDTHHTVDGYTFPPIETIRGVWHSWRVRGADCVEFFNWMGEGDEKVLDIIKQLVFEYGTDPARDCFVEYAQEDFTGVNDLEYLAKQDKTYVIDRKGGYPWGIGYGNLNADRQLPCLVEKEGSVLLYVGDDAKKYKSASLKVLLEETDEEVQIYLNGKLLTYESAPCRDLQVTTEKEAPISGYGVTIRLLSGKDISKPCTMFTCPVLDSTPIGYNEVKVVCKNTVSIEKVELELKEKI